MVIIKILTHPCYIMTCWLILIGIKQKNQKNWVDARISASEKYLAVTKTIQGENKLDMNLIWSMYMVYCVLDVQVAMTHKKIITTMLS